MDICLLEVNVDEKFFAKKKDEDLQFRKRTFERKLKKYKLIINQRFINLLTSPLLSTTLYTVNI